MLERARDKDQEAVTFVLPSDHPAGDTSVVGDFNSWRPGIHRFNLRRDGSRAVTIDLPLDRQFAFRYLSADGWWFDEETADGHDGRNSLLHT
ncbi:isoamylase early set domain-containing protein [Kitasatospora sp. NPDC059673]|uniref:isoamylase early set domain-containing protein n=1 Tax=Kitasatospora sp. NPDC059673 TaxID=3346901 RepID=UPI0036A27E20